MQRDRLRSKNPEQIRLRRARSYSQTKKHPNRFFKHQARAAQYRKDTRAWLAAYKLAKGCADCGYRAHAAALQLDHEGVKAVEIAEARSSIRRLKAEIIAGECKVRCANCHSIRTWERKQTDGGRDRAISGQKLSPQEMIERVEEGKSMIRAMPPVGRPAPSQAVEPASAVSPLRASVAIARKLTP